MPLPSTMTPIATATLTSPQALVTFSSIPQTYTDLVLVVAFSTTSASDDSGSFQFNNSVAPNYSSRHLTGNGSSASTGYNTVAGGVTLAYQKNSDGIVFATANIMNYANTTTYKTTMVKIANAATYFQYNVNLWSNTSAINEIDIFFGPNMTTGSTFTLYGIKAA
jgi:hypothetical protein